MPMTSHRRSHMLPLLLVPPLLLLACGTDSEGQEDDSDVQGRSDPSVVVALPEEPATIDICDTGPIHAARVSRTNISESLTYRNPDTNEIEPMLAVSWEQVDDTHWDFELRQDVDFHDGEHLDAEAVAYSINRQFIPELECSLTSQNFGDVVVEAEAIDDYTVQLSTRNPDAILPLRANFLEIVSPNTPDDSITQEPVGTGPYQFLEWVPGQHITLEAFEGYWGEQPDVQEATYVFRSEESVRVGMIETGEADIAIGLSPQHADHELAELFDIPEVTGLRMDVLGPPFDDIRVRQAVTHAIDREGLIQAMWDGVGTPASLPIVGTAVGYNPDIEIPEYNPDLAAELVEDARQDGVDVEVEVTIFGRIGLFPNSRAFSEAAAEMLNDVGLNVTVEMLEVGAWIEILHDHPDDRHGLLAEAHGNALGDSSMTLGSRYHSSQPRSQIPLDRRDDIDQMIEEAAAASGDERVTKMHEFWEVITGEIIQDVWIAEMASVILLAEDLSYPLNVDSYEVVDLASISLS